MKHMLEGFGQNESGVAALLCGLSRFMLFFCVGLAIDGSRTRAINAMSDCAMWSAHDFDADTNDQLRAAFQSVADQLNAMRTKS